MQNTANKHLGASRSVSVARLAGRLRISQATFDPARRWPQSPTSMKYGRVRENRSYVLAVGSLETVVADESLALIDLCRIVRRPLQSSGTGSEVGDSNSLALLPGWLHENCRDCGRLTSELQRGPLSNIQNNI
jgi:hypothetical protein